MTTPAEAIAQNNAMRQALLATAPRGRKKLGVFGPFSMGQAARIKLFNVGVTTSLDVMVYASVDHTADLTPSPRAPFNLLEKIKLTDYDGTDRVNCSGYQLWVNRTLKMDANELNGYHNSAGRTATESLPSVPTTADGTLRFLLNVPLAYDPERDLRGALLTQTNTGEAYLNLDFNDAALTAGDADAVYTAGTLGANSISDIYVVVWQNYLSPLQIGNSVPLPLIDLNTVYELNGSVYSSDNISVGAEKLINFPNVRTVLATYVEYVNNGVMSALSTDVTQIRLIANGNNVIQEWGPYDLSHRIREQIGCDLPKGTLYFSTRSRPVETALYGNVQLGITPAVVNAGNTYMQTMFEAFYSKGSTLPGMSQG